MTAPRSQLHVINGTRAARDDSVTAREVIAHLAGVVGAGVTVTIKIEAEIPSGVPEQVVRIVTENGRSSPPARGLRRSKQ